MFERILGIMIGFIILVVATAAPTRASDRGGESSECQGVGLDGRLCEYGQVLDPMNGWFIVDPVPPSDRNDPNQGFRDQPLNSAFNIGGIGVYFVPSEDRVYVALEILGRGLANPDEGKVPFDSDGDGDPNDLPTDNQAPEYYRVIIKMLAGPNENCQTFTNIPFPEDMNPFCPEDNPNTPGKGGPRDLIGVGDYDLVLLSIGGRLPGKITVLTSPPMSDLRFSLGAQGSRGFPNGNVEFEINNFDFNGMAGVRVLAIADSKGDNLPADIAGGCFFFPEAYAELSASRRVAPGVDRNRDGQIDAADACMELEGSYETEIQALSGASVFIRSMVGAREAGGFFPEVVVRDLNTEEGCGPSRGEGTDITALMRLVDGGEKTEKTLDPTMGIPPGDFYVRDAAATYTSDTRSCLTFSAELLTDLFHAVSANALVDIVRPGLDVSVLVDDDDEFNQPDDLTPPRKSLALESPIASHDLTLFLVVTNIGETALTGISVASPFMGARRFGVDRDLDPGETVLVDQRTIRIRDGQHCDDLDERDGFVDGRIRIDATAQSEVKIDNFGLPASLDANGQSVITRMETRGSASIFCVCPQVVTFDQDALGRTLGPVTDVSGSALEDLGVRISGRSGRNGNPGVFTNVPGPPGSETDDLIPVSGNYLTTLANPARPLESEYGRMCVDFVDPVMHMETTVSCAQITFLDVESSVGRVIAYSEPGCTGQILDVGSTTDNGIEDNMTSGNQDVVTVGMLGSSMKIASIEILFGTRFDSAAVDHLCFEYSNLGIVMNSHSPEEVFVDQAPLHVTMLALNLGRVDHEGFLIPYLVLRPRDDFERVVIGDPIAVSIPSGTPLIHRQEYSLPDMFQEHHAGQTVTVGHLLCDNQDRVVANSRTSVRFLPSRR